MYILQISVNKLKLKTEHWIGSFWDVWNTYWHSFNGKAPRPLRCTTCTRRKPVDGMLHCMKERIREKIKCAFGGTRTNVFGNRASLICSKGKYLAFAYFYDNPTSKIFNRSVNLILFFFFLFYFGFYAFLPFVNYSGIQMISFSTV